MAEEPTKPNLMATATASAAAGLTFKVLAPLFVAMGGWLSTHSGVVFPEGYGTDLKEWALVAVPVVTAWWHSRGR